MRVISSALLPAVDKLQFVDGEDVTRQQDNKLNTECRESMPTVDGCSTFLKCVVNTGTHTHKRVEFRIRLEMRASFAGGSHASRRVDRETPTKPRRTLPAVLLRGREQGLGSKEHLRKQDAEAFHGLSLGHLLAEIRLNL